ncbi:MAG: allophanate hydrolase subunit 1 [Fimbriimonadales bacterium]
MRLFRLSERAVLVRGLADRVPAALAEEIQRQGWEELEEAVAAYESVALYFRSAMSDLESLRRRLDRVEATQASIGRVWRIPVCYELGPDLEAAAARLGLSVADVAAMHAGTEYRCFAVGFSAGFPYLGYLPDELCGLPRLESPRPRVPAGSVGVTGRQTCIYPSETPGGWWLIGRTPLQVASLQLERFPIRPGDRVRFVPIQLEQFDAMLGRPLWEQST